MDVATFLDSLQRARGYEQQIVAHEVLPATAACYALLDPPLPPALQGALSAQGIERLYTHQTAAIEHARAGRDVVVVTGTASGKTLCYNLPVVERLLADRRRRALYLFPLKALANDQRRQLAALGLPRTVRCATYDGDTPPAERRLVRQIANVVLTNPDMLHVGILPRHQLWSELLANLDYVVIDEVHLYRGVFGSHAARVLRRLWRLCEQYGSRPTVIACSATIANPAEHCEQLIGRRCEVVAENGAPRGAKHLVVWNPPLRDAAAGLRRSGNIEATWLLAELAQCQIRSLGFAVARQEAELVLRYLRAALEGVQPSLVPRVSAYRAGYLPAERRKIEERLASGDLLAVVSTVALEAGIDIGGLDATVMVGFPGTVAGFWQQAGRAGRARRDSLAILVCRASLIDQHFAAHPADLWGAPTEAARIDPTNPYIGLGHVLCAAYEQPLSDPELRSLSGTPQLAELLAEEGFLKKRGGRWFYARDDYPAAQVSLRTADHRSLTLQQSDNGAVLGTVDPARLYDECFPGAVHLHEGEQYLVEQVDEAERRVAVRPVEVDWFTNPLVSVEVQVLQARQSGQFGELAAGLGDLTVTRQTVGYRRQALGSFEVLSLEVVECPPQELDTYGFWLVPSPALQQFLLEHAVDPLAALHGVEHALSGALPLVAMCDLRDTRGASVALHHQIGEPALFLFDQHPGGVGLAERGFERLDLLLRRSHQAIAQCGCAAGCPACIQSPFCGSYNAALDKLGAQIVLRAALGLDWRQEPSA